MRNLCWSAVPVVRWSIILTLIASPHLAVADLPVLFRTGGGVEVLVDRRLPAEGHPALDVPIARVTDVAVDGAGNVYYLDAGHGLVRRIGADGRVESIFDQFKDLERGAFRQMAVDGRTGAVYVGVENRIWVVRDGVAEVFAGTGEFGSIGDGGPALDAAFQLIADLAVAPEGTLYVVDGGPIRAVAPDGIVRSMAGGAFDALDRPAQIAAGPEGVLYVVDRGFNRRLQRIFPDGSAVELFSFGAVDSLTIADNGDLVAKDVGIYRYDQGGYRTRIGRESFKPIAADGSGIIGYEWRRYQLFRMDADGNVDAIAGNGTGGRFGDGGPVQQAAFSCNDLVVDQGGRIFMTDTQDLRNERIAVIEPDGTFDTLVEESCPEDRNSGEPSPSLCDPRGIVLGPDGKLYVVAPEGFGVYRVDPESGTVDRVAGKGIPGIFLGFSGDGGPATEASLDNASDLEITATGEILISDTENQRLRRVDTSGIISTVALFDGYPNRLSPHPDGGVVVSFAGPENEVKVEASGEIGEFPFSTGNMSIVHITPEGAPLLTSGGALFLGRRDREPLLLFESKYLSISEAAMDPNGDLVFCGLRGYILRIKREMIQRAAQCPGDCSGDDRVAVNELVTAVEIALSSPGPDRAARCPAVDRDLNDEVTIDELVGAVVTALDGCP